MAAFTQVKWLLQQEGQYLEFVLKSIYLNSNPNSSSSYLYSDKWLKLSILQLFNLQQGKNGHD